MILFLGLTMGGFINATYVTVNGVQVWENSSQMFGNITNSTSPIGAIGNVVNSQLPWFWPLFTFLLYIYLYILYSDSPSGGKLYGIAALVLIISVFLALGGNIADGVINFIIFGVTFFVANQFKHL